MWSVTELDHVSSNFSKVTETLFPSATHFQVSISTLTVAKCVEMQTEGVPVRGIIDTGSEWTCFPRNCHKNNLKKQDFKPADRNACTYGQQPLYLNGQMDLNIKFGESCVCETVYIKLDAPDTLFLSENVCHTLKIVVSYHLMHS